MGREEPRLRVAKRLFRGHPYKGNITSVGLGFRRRGGKLTDELCVVVGVRHKWTPERATSYNNAPKLIPKEISGIPTDVQQKEFKALAVFARRRRPCPPGFSIGHVSITAGTLGAYVKHGTSEGWHILSNNHVLANSNAASLGDRILQPGDADGGTDPLDWLASLKAFAVIRFDGENGGGNGGNGGGKDCKKKDNSIARFAWKLGRGIPNTIAAIIRCPYRLPAPVIPKTAIPIAVTQPYPNLIDGAVGALRLQSNVDLDFAGSDIGELNGIRALRLGDRVRKVGRTTGFTQGMVEVVSSMLIVQYGLGKTATFDDQVEIRADDGEFSAGGDSGSAILTEDDYMGGLLFAGGGGVTIANQIGNVVAILGIRL